MIAVAATPDLHIVKHDLGVDTKSVTIVPLADVHMGNPAFNERIFLSYRDWILETPDTYCVIAGDLIEMATKGSVSSCFEGLRPREQRKLAVKYLQPLADKGKILAYLDGNHEARANKDADEYPGEEICAQLGIPSLYSPDGIYMFLQLGYRPEESKKNRIVYTAFMLHGWTGARTLGGKANNLEALTKSVMADVYLMGHTHTIFGTPRRIIVSDIRTKSLYSRRQLLVNTGSFLDWAGYAVRKGYNPQELGAPVVILDGRKHYAQCTV